MATESFFSNASLAYLASAGAGKDGKTYSIKPTDGSGDFTFSRGSNLAATRVGPTGLIEKGRENLLKQSNNFDTTWITPVSITKTSGQSGYDGSNDAWKIESNGVAAYDAVYQYISISGVNTYSVYAKAGTNNIFVLRSAGAVDARAYFNLSAVSVSVNSSVIDASIESVGNDWYRCSMTFNGANSVVYVYPNELGIASAGYIYIQDAQLEIGLAATEVITTGATTGKAGLLEDEPRFDYSGGATCPSLLLEPERSQLIPNSEYLIDGLTNVTATYNYGTSPDGLNNSTFILPTTAIAAHRLSYTDLFTYAPSTSYVASAFLKSGGHRYVTINLALRNSGSFQESAIGFVDLEQNTIVVNGSNTLWTSLAVFKEEYANGFYRYGVTAKTPSSGSDRVDVQFNITDENGNSFAGNGTDGVVFYGLQAESGSYPTSYIPNHSGGSVTRGEETTSALTLPEPLTDNYTLFFDFKEINTVNNWIAFLDSSNNPVYTFFGYSGHYDVNNGSAYILESSADPNGKIALQQSGSSIKVFVNGVNKVKAGATANLTDIVKFRFGSRNSNNSATLRQMLFFPTALSDEACIELTTIS